ncbi:AAA family ATPase, partial [Streptomyces sp. GC420]|uniref:AAA family ATPase n=1 Tax=Streptomyces sp. GC420 TaxID=2697568 RepID=UPI001414EC5B
MRLHRLSITAFGPFGGTQEVDFDELSAAGLFLLHGPTGAGKTSVLDAVCYALYGSVPGARQAPGASLRSDHAASGLPTEILLELTVGGRRLEITRRPEQLRPKKRGTGFTRDKAQSRLREYDAPAGQWKALSRSHQEIGEEIAQLLGMSKEQFCQVVLLPQGDFAKFLRADAEARGRLLGRLFDTRRFAAVEERLAERRRATEARVRAGDDRLLAIAHRMAQAAGAPGPDGWSPGEPGLAEAVLQWAAIHRADARERMTVRHLAARTAESRRKAARAELEEARELGRLRRRYDEARERAGRLAERAPEQRELEALLARARKAETVAPALTLRTGVEEEHRGAAAEERRARALLPPGQAEASGAGLTAYERALRRELGGLESARRAERRLADIAAERERLDRQARADEELLREHAEWSGGWDALRRAHRDRVDHAQEAATRAAGLGGRLDTAERRLAAARRRDDLVRGLGDTRDLVALARDREAAARGHWLDLREQRLRGIAAELAAELSDGQPCGVCGSTEHPRPARRSDGHVDRATEEAALAAHRTAQESRAAAEAELSALREQLAATRASVADLAGLPARSPAAPARGMAPARGAVRSRSHVRDGGSTASELKNWLTTIVAWVRVTAFWYAGSSAVKSDNGIPEEWMV